MTLEAQIDTALKEAMKAKEEVRLRTLKMLLAELKNAALAKRAKSGRAEILTDPEVLEIISREVKKRRDARALYEKGGRADLAEREKAEEGVLLAYLPPELTEAELRTIIEEAIVQSGAEGPAALGKVMGFLSPQTRGRADGARVVALVRELLA